MNGFHSPSQPYYSDDTTTVYADDCLTILRSMPSNSVDAVVTDPPYGLTALPHKKVAETLSRWLSGDTSYIPAGGEGFMSLRWDRFVPPPSLWVEVYRVLKPGGFVSAFAGTRTQDLMGMSMRLAGFSIKDGLQWIRADVFPKTKHSLKPGYEPILLGQKALDGTIANNIAVHGVGGLNIEDSRTPFASEADELESKGKNKHAVYGTQHGGNAIYGDFTAGGTRGNYNAPGRWPTNVMLTGAAAEALDRTRPATDLRPGPSRFFPRLDEEPSFFYAGRATKSERPVAEDGTSHVSVKPLSVMRWLNTLLCPPGGLILDPFAGSGTTLEAARQAGFRSIGIESHCQFSS